jgi:hypothetical protein
MSWSDLNWDAVAAITGVLAPFIALFLGAWAFNWQLRKNMQFQVYTDAVSALYEAETFIAQRIQGHVYPQSCSAEDRKEMLKVYLSLLGRIGRLHLVGKPATIQAVNEVSDALWRIYDGLVPAAPDTNHIVTKMRVEDIDTLVNPFYDARASMLISMRKDFGHEMRNINIEINYMADSFLRDFENRPLSPDQGIDGGAHVDGIELREKARRIKKVPVASKKPSKKVRSNEDQT